MTKDIGLALTLGTTYSFVDVAKVIQSCVNAAVNLW